MPDISSRVLVVDDEAPIRDLLSDLLKKENCSVKSASCGQEALSLISGEIFDIVILDIKLPDISGIEVLKRIKEKNPDLPVVMITGFGYDEDLITQSRQYGCSGYIGKNVPLPQIMSNLRLFVKAACERRKNR